MNYKHYLLMHTERKKTFIAKNMPVLLAQGITLYSDLYNTRDFRYQLFHYNMYMVEIATSWENVSLRFCKQVRLKLACSATEASYNLETLDIASIGIMLSKQ